MATGVAATDDRASLQFFLAAADHAEDAPAMKAHHDAVVAANEDMRQRNQR